MRDDPCFVLEVPGVLMTTALPAMANNVAKAPQQSGKGTFEL